MKKENIPYIFSAFKRVNEEKNRHIEGTGLGLSIVHQLVELMGGEISVNSVYTKGSTFLAKPVSGTLLEAAVLSILPKALVKLSEEAVPSEIGKDILIFEQAQRMFLMITTDSVCDLPESLKKEFGIVVCPYGFWMR